MLYDLIKDTRIMFKTHLRLRAAYGKLSGATNSANLFTMYRSAGFQSLSDLVREKAVGEADLSFPIRNHIGWDFWPGWIELDGITGTLEYEIFSDNLHGPWYQSLTCGLNLNFIFLSSPLAQMPDIQIRYTFWTKGGGQNTLWLSTGIEF